MRASLRPLRELFRPVGIPLAWLQLTSNPGRFAAALAGAAFSAMLMIFQMSAYEAILHTKAVRPIHGLDADLVMVGRGSINFYVGGHFPRRRLARMETRPGVAEASPLYLGSATWRDPWTRELKEAYVFGLEPAHPIFSFPGLREQQAVLKQEDALLFDQTTPAYFGPVKEMVQAHGAVRGEVAGRRVRVAGLFTLGPTLHAECHLIGGTQAFFRLFNDRTPDQVDLGAVRLKPGMAPLQARDELRRGLPADVELLTKEEFSLREQGFWESRGSFGFAINAMTAVALLTGAAVVYLILYTDVNEHLPEFATLKAIGLTDRFLERLVLVEALILHLMGCALGCLLTVVVFRVVAGRADLPLRMGPGTLGRVFLFTALMCGAAGMAALRRLRRADPADAF